MSSAFGQASVDSNGQINFTSSTDIPGTPYIHHQSPVGNGHTADASTIFLPTGAQLSGPPGEHGQLVLHQTGAPIPQPHGPLQPELPGVVQGPGGTLESLDSVTSTSNIGGTTGKKKHGGLVYGKNKKLQQHVAHTHHATQVKSKNFNNAVKAKN